MIIELSPSQVRELIKLINIKFLNYQKLTKDIIDDITSEYYTSQKTQIIVLIEKIHVLQWLSNYIDEFEKLAPEQFNYLTNEIDDLVDKSISRQIKELLNI